MEFTPINTQEEFDERLRSRLERERNSIRKELEQKYADYESIKTSLAESTQQLTDTQSKISGFESQIGELNNKVKKYETDSVKTRIGLENGLPMELISRISGDTEDEIKADAEKLAKLMKPAGRQRFYDPESNQGGKDNAAYKNMLKQMNLGG